MEHNTAASTGPGLLAGVSALARNGFGLLVSRVELAALELSQARNHAIDLLAVFVLAIISGWFALACGTALLVVLSWASMGWTILLVLLLGFLAVTLGLLAKARAMLREGRLTLPETMNELRNDRDMLL